GDDVPVAVDVDVLQAVDPEHLVDVVGAVRLIAGRAVGVADTDPVLQDIRRVGLFTLDEAEGRRKLGAGHVTPYDLDLALDVHDGLGVQAGGRSETGDCECEGEGEAPGGGRGGCRRRTSGPPGGGERSRVVGVAGGGGAAGGAGGRGGAAAPGPRRRGPRAGGGGGGGGGGRGRGGGGGGGGGSWV